MGCIRHDERPIMSAMAVKSTVLGIALALASVLSASCSGSADSALKAADRLADEQKDREAVIEYRKAIQKNPPLGEARLQLARAHMRPGARATALEQFARAADGVP